MTKQEVRAISVSHLRLFPGAVAYDIGAGTGSVSVECALLGCQRVFAIEKDPAAIRVLEENISLFELDNIQVVSGHAPEAMEQLPAADRIFLGGSGGNLPAILEGVKQKLKPGGWLVANSVTVDTGPEVMDFLQKNGFNNINVVVINVARAVSRGRVRLWQALNPVQIISGQKGEN